MPYTRPTQVIVQNGKATLQFKVKEDNTLENDELLSVNVVSNSNVVSQAQLTVCENKTGQEVALSSDGQYLAVITSKPTKSTRTLEVYKNLSTGLQKLNYADIEGAIAGLRFSNNSSNTLFIGGDSNVVAGTPSTANPIEYDLLTGTVHTFTPVDFPTEDVGNYGVSAFVSTTANGLYALVSRRFYIFGDPSQNIYTDGALYKKINDTYTLLNSNITAFRNEGGSIIDFAELKFIDNDTKCIGTTNATHTGDNGGVYLFNFANEDFSLINYYPAAVPSIYTNIQFEWFDLFGSEIIMFNRISGNESYRVQRTTITDGQLTTPTLINTPAAGMVKGHMSPDFKYMLKYHNKVAEYGTTDDLISLAVRNQAGGYDNVIPLTSTGNTPEFSYFRSLSITNYGATDVLIALPAINRYGFIVKKWNGSQLVDIPVIH